DDETVPPEPESTPATEPGETPTPSTAPTETPSASYEEAFPGLPALGMPVALIEAPGEEYMVVLLQEGRMVGFPREGPYDEPHTVLDMRDGTRTSFEVGLLSLAFDPRF